MAKIGSFRRRQNILPKGRAGGLQRRDERLRVINIGKLSLARKAGKEDSILRRNE